MGNWYLTSLLLIWLSIGVLPLGFAQNDGDVLVSPFNGKCTSGLDCSILTTRSNKLESADQAQLTIDTLAPFLRRQGCGLNYKAQGVKLSNRTAPFTTINPRFTISGISSANGVEVVEAYLYWIVEGNKRSSSVKLTSPVGSRTVIGELVGLNQGGKCWPCNFTMHYRADVKDMLCPYDPNGEYVLADYPAGHRDCPRPPVCIGGFDVPGGCEEGDADGALLIIIYRDLSADYFGSLSIDDGCIVRLGGERLTYTMNGGSLCSVPSEATAFMAIGDMQAGSAPPHNVTFGTATFPIQPQFFNFESLQLSLPSSSLTSVFGTENVAGGDCYSVMLTGIYAQSKTCQTACSPVIKQTAQTNGRLDTVTTCLDGNPITLTLTGHSGTILRWEHASSCDVGTWSAVNQTQTKLTVNAPNDKSCWRVVIRKDGCLTYSSLGRVRINSVSDAGRVSPSQKICKGQQPSILQLSASSLTVLRWEFAHADNCAAANLTWTSVAHTQPNFLPPAPERNTCWRAVAQQGSCGASASSPALLETLPELSAGRLEIAGGDCASGQGTLLNLTGHQGQVLAWEYAPVCGQAWQTINQTGTSYELTQLRGPGCYRVRVGQDGCNPVFTAEVNVEESGSPISGAIVGPGEHCPESGLLTLRLEGNSGQILRWEWSSNDFSTINTLAQGENPLQFNWPVPGPNRIQFRVVVKLRDCPPQAIGPISVNRVSGPTPPSVQGPTTSCLGGSPFILRAINVSAPILYWEYQQQGQSAWTMIPSNETQISAGPLTATRSYRVVVDGGSCLPVASQPHTVFFVMSGSGGVVTGGGSFCSAGASVELQLSGFQGRVIRWERSPNGQSGWTPVSNTNTKLTVSVETSPVWYRAQVQTGDCPAVFSSPDSVLLLPAVQAGSVQGPDEVCAGSENFTLRLTGATAPVVRWQASTNGGQSWQDISSAGQTEIAAGPILQLTTFRAQVALAGCPPQTSSTKAVNLTAPPVGGSLSGAKSGCGNDLNAQLVLSGYSGTILRWETQQDGSSGWSPLTWQEPILSVSTLMTTTRYRAVIGRGSCPNAVSTEATLQILPPSIGGQLLADATVCRGQTSPLMTLNGHLGSVQGWHFSKDAGANWTLMGKAGATQLQSGRLTADTWFKVEVQSPGCPPAWSSIAKMTVKHMPRSGYVFGDSLLCEQNVGTLLQLVGAQGNVSHWQASADSLAWANRPSSQPNLATGVLSQTTWYRAIMEHNGCAADTSEPFKVRLAPLSQGGTLTESRSICSGGLSGLLELSGQRGDVRFWETSEDAGQSWTTIAYRGQSYLSDPLYRSVWYRVVVQNGECPAVRSTVAKITLVDQLAGGTLQGGPSFCSNQTKLTLKLTGSSGSVDRWEFSADGGRIWINIPHTGTQYEVQNIVQPTRFRVFVQSGICAGVYSTERTIIPRPAPTVSLKGAVGCEGWGQIEAAATGGTPGYAYSIEPMVLPSNSSGFFAPLKPQVWTARVTDAAGCTDEASIDLSALEPAPEILGVMNVAAHTASVVWRPVPGANVSYRVGYRLVGQPNADYFWIENIRTSGVFLSNLQQDTDYEVVVEARCGQRVIRAPLPAFFKTLTAGDCSTQPPPPPGGLYIDQITPYSAVLRWTPIRNLRPWQGYVLSIGRKEVNPNNWPQFVVCSPDSAYVFSGLSPSSAYGARIRTNCSNCTTALQSKDRRSEWSRTLDFNTLAFRAEDVESKPQSSGLTLYPNPARQGFYLNWPDAAGEAEVQIFDVAGRSLWRRNVSWQESLFVEPVGLAAGSYLVFVRLKDGRNARARLMLVE